MHKQKHFRPEDLKENPRKYTISILDVFRQKCTCGHLQTLNKRWLLKAVCKPWLHLNGYQCQSGSWGPHFSKQASPHLWRLSACEAFISLINQIIPPDPNTPRAGSSADSESTAELGSPTWGARIALAQNPDSHAPIGLTSCQGIIIPFDRKAPFLLAYSTARTEHSFTCTSMYALHVPCTELGQLDFCEWTANAGSNGIKHLPPFATAAI